VGVGRSPSGWLPGTACRRPMLGTGRGGSGEGEALTAAMDDAALALTGDRARGQEDHGGNGGVSGQWDKRWRSLVQGQILSLLTATTGACTSLLTSRTDLIAPAAQNVPNYMLLCTMLLCPSRLSRVRCFGLLPKVPPRPAHVVPSRPQNEFLAYAFISLVDVEANVLVVWAYQYTSITSAMLIDCFAIPSVMLLSKLFLRAQYTWQHIGGACLCLLGLGCIILSDAYISRSTDDEGATYPNAVKGDIMCFAGAFLYAVSNVAQERWVQSAGPPKYLGRLGIGGFVISLCQAMIFERQKIFRRSAWSTIAIVAWVCYTCALTSAYALTSWFLLAADATFFNLSLLTSDVYAVLFAFVTTGHLVGWLYFVAFATTMSGLFVYHRAPAAVEKRAASEDSYLVARSPRKSGGEGGDGEGDKEYDDEQGADAAGQGGGGGGMRGHGKYAVVC